MLVSVYYILVTFFYPFPALGALCGNYVLEEHPSDKLEEILGKLRFDNLVQHLLGQHTVKTYLMIDIGNTKWNMVSYGIFGSPEAYFCGLLFSKFIKIFFPRSFYI